MEKCYTPTEIAKQLGKHPSTIRRWFRDVKGVIVIGAGSRRVGKNLVRRYASMEVPASVFEKWVAQRTNK